MWPLILLGIAAWAKSRADAAQMGAQPSRMQDALDARTRIVSVPQVPWGKATMGPAVAHPSIAVPVVARNRTIPGSAMTTGLPSLGPIPPLSELMEFDVMVAKPDPAAAIPIQHNPKSEHLQYGRTD